MNRRGLIGGVVGGVAAVAVAGAAAVKFRLFGKHYAATSYDDLLNQIIDRDPAAQLGQAAVKAMPDFNLPRLAAQLRQPGHALRVRAPQDVEQGRLIAVGGWMVPESVALYAALAARV